MSRKRDVFRGICSSIGVPDAGILVDIYEMWENSPFATSQIGSSTLEDVNEDGNSSTQNDLEVVDGATTVAPAGSSPSISATTTTTNNNNNISISFSPLLEEDGGLTSNASTSPVTSSTPVSSTIDVTSSFPVLLKDENSYFSWRVQFLDLLKLHGLQHTVSSDFTPPPSNSNSPVFLLWKETDKLVLSWIMSTVSSTLKSMLVPCTSAKEAWDILENHLAPQRKNRFIRGLFERFFSFQKTSNSSMIDYLLKARELQDSLAAISFSLPEDSLVELVLDGIDPDVYKEFLTGFSHRPPTPFPELCSLLLSEEHRLSLQLKSTVA